MPSASFPSLHPLTYDTILEGDVLYSLGRLWKKNDVQGIENTGHRTSCETAWNNWLGSKYSVSSDSVLIAHECVFSALREFTGTGEVILSSFASSFSKKAVINSGLTPIFVQSTAANFPCFDEKSLEKNINGMTRAIVVTHALGFNGLSKEILELCSRAGIKLVEEVLESSGVTFKHKRAGTTGLVGIFHFNLTKDKSTCGLGIISTNDEKYFHLVRDLNAKRLIERETRKSTEDSFQNRAEVDYGFLPNDPLHGENGVNFANLNVPYVLAESRFRRLNRENNLRTNNCFRFVDRLDKELFQTFVSAEGNSADFFVVVLCQGKSHLINKLHQRLKEFGIEFSQDSCVENGEKYKETPLLIRNDPNMGNSKIDFILRILNNIEKEATPTSKSIDEEAAIEDDSNVLIDKMTNIYWAGRKKLKQLIL